MSRSLYTVLNEANPNKLPNALQQAQLGNIADLTAKFAKGAVVSNVLVLPEEARAAGILTALATAGTTPGFKTPVLHSATVATLQCKVDAVGNIAFFATDAITAAEVVYFAAEGDVVQDDIIVTPGTGIGTLDGDAVILLSATVLTGTALGAKTVLTRAESAPAAGNVNLGLTANQVRFAVADAVATARVRYVAKPAVTVDAAIRSQVNY